MCGITGFWNTEKLQTNRDLISTVTRMRDIMHHRGPDDSGEWVDETSGIALGFRRLAIVDLSPTGHQPMFSADQRYVMIYNGEVYNYAELRAELDAAGYQFRGTSDTEVMLAGILEWGLERAVTRFNGMFAIALWDRQEKKLHLIRDRVGVKPLYYGWCGRTLLFGSELKALNAHPSFKRAIDRQSLTLYLRYGYVPAPHSIYQGVKKLEPGNILTFDEGMSQTEGSSLRYWSAREVVERGLQNPFLGSDQDAISELDHLLRASVRDRMIADVPLGAFLSGGIDSSTVVAMMQVQSARPVKTFTIGFQEAGYNEAEYAKEVAAHLKTDHTELYVSPRDAMDVIPQLAFMFDEPLGDSSQIPTYLVSKLARESVTVSLSGDGGDELFGGYNRYFNSLNVWSLVGNIPFPVRKVAGAVFDQASKVEWHKITSHGRLSTRFYHLSEITKMRSADELYWRFSSNWEQPRQVVVDGREPPAFHMAPENAHLLPEFAQRMMYLDFNTYLPDDILVKLDRASMATSLEGRVPLLDDHRVVEFAWRLPLHMKIRSGKGKWILRQVLHQYIPQKMVDRPKMGFGVPIDSWLRGPLRDWAESLLDETRLRQEGYLNPGPIRKRWTEHLQKQKDWQYPLWYVLMFQDWLGHGEKNLIT
ncbi:MAG TPA: asparagine synthase (glutamine-hydrolyzing) [Anaerolineales bacterium]|nr:asparagine synthase (glutamine-hydrolyzing) [Anaerolineales bacterium]